MSSVIRESCVIVLVAAAITWGLVTAFLMMAALVLAPLWPIALAIWALR